MRQQRTATVIRFFIEAARLDRRSSSKRALSATGSNVQFWSIGSLQVRPQALQMTGLLGDEVGRSIHAAGEPPQSTALRVLNQ